MMLDDDYLDYYDEIEYIIKNDDPQNVSQLMDEIFKMDNKETKQYFHQHYGDRFKQQMAADAVRDFEYNGWTYEVVKTQLHETMDTVDFPRVVDDLD